MGPLSYVVHQWMKCSGTHADYIVLGYSKLIKIKGGGVGTENKN